MLQKDFIELKKSLEKQAKQKDSTLGLLSTSWPQLNAALGGGLKKGSLIEWGVPPAKKGREVLLTFLGNPKIFTLWVYGQEGVKVYPPAFSARGIDLSRLYFLASANPIKDIKPVFLEPGFDVVIIDSPKCLFSNDLAFMAHQARLLRQTILLLRPYLLSSKLGNPFANVRLNVYYQANRQGYAVELLRGGNPSYGKLFLPMATR